MKAYTQTEGERAPTYTHTSLRFRLNLKGDQGRVRKFSTPSNRITEPDGEEELLMDLCMNTRTFFSLRLTPLAFQNDNSLFSNGAYTGFIKKHQLIFPPWL